MHLLLLRLGQPRQEPDEYHRHNTCEAQHAAKVIATQLIAALIAPIAAMVDFPLQ